MTYCHRCAGDRVILVHTGRGRRGGYTAAPCPVCAPPDEFGHDFDKRAADAEREAPAPE